MPRISVVTATFETKPEILARTWASLKRQTFTDWEWVIWDDSHSNEVWRQLYGYASDERFVIRMHKSHVHSGLIGEVKHNAFMVSNGEILVELDHDDELTPTALQQISRVFEDQEVGFAYSDWCEINEEGESCRYPDGWAFGYGDHYWDEQEGVWAMRAPDINETTMSHIVSAPNHVRAWKSDVYRSIGGHNKALRVADDYDICVRTYLSTKMVRIPSMLYKQHISTQTAQRVYNSEIQVRVAEIASAYQDRIHERAAEVAV